MAVSVKQVTLWRSEVANRPGALAAALGPWPAPERTSGSSWAIGSRVTRTARAI